LACLCLTVAITIGLYMAIPKGFFPQQDNGLINGATQAAPDVSHATMVLRMRALADRVRGDKDIQNV